MKVSKPLSECVAFRGSPRHIVLDVARVSRSDTSIKFMHDIYEMKDVRRVVQTARLLLMQRIQQERYNTLLSEGWACLITSVFLHEADKLFCSWQITVYRKGNKHRVEVTYTGRAAYITTKPKTRSAPPFIDILEFYRRDMCTM